MNTSLLHSDHPLVKTNHGGDNNKSHTDKYFELYSIDILVEAIRVILAQSSLEPSIDVKPYRLLTSLLDKPQIGPVILDTILYDVFRSLYLTCVNQVNLQNNSNGRCVSFTGDINSLKYGTTFCNKNTLTRQFLNKNCQELIKNANLLFNTLEAYYIWNYMGRAYEISITNASKDSAMKPSGQVHEIGAGKPNILELCILTDFLLDVIPIETYIDNTSEILPNLFIKLVTLMKDNIRILNKFQISQSLELCTKILNKIQPVVVKNIVKQEVETASVTFESLETRNSIAPSEQSNPESNNSSLLLTESLVQTENDLSKSFNGKESKFGSQLEKSKSDSKINENGLGSELHMDLNRERSNSNQMFKKKHSPRIEKKSKNKKSKSSSKLYDLKKDEHSDLSSLDIPQSEKNEVVLLDDTAESLTIPIHTKTENKHIMRCLNIYKKFYIVFILSKVIPEINITAIFEKLRYNVDNRTKDLEILLQKSIDNQDSFKPKSHSSYRKLTNIQFNERPICQSIDYNSAMKIASSILLEFNSFPNISEEHKDENDVPFWIKVLTICGCYPQRNNSEIQLIAINTLLEMLSLAKVQNIQANNNENTKVIVMGILRHSHVSYLENCTYMIEVS